MAVYLQGGVVLLDSGLVATSDNCCCSDTGSCCCSSIIPIGSCHVLTESGCIAAGGTYRGDGTPCDEDHPCLGACCRTVDGAHTCSIETKDDCDGLSGTWVCGKDCSVTGHCCDGQVCFDENSGNPYADACCPDLHADGLCDCITNLHISAHVYGTITVADTCGTPCDRTFHFDATLFTTLDQVVSPCIYGYDNSDDATVCTGDNCNVHLGIFFNHPGHVTVFDPRISMSFTYGDCGCNEFYGGAEICPGGGFETDITMGITTPDVPENPCDWPDAGPFFVSGNATWSDCIEPCEDPCGSGSGPESGDINVDITMTYS